MPLPLTVSCFSEIQIGFTFLVPAHLGSPGKRAVKRVCVCVCDYRIGSPASAAVLSSAASPPDGARAASLPAAGRAAVQSGRPPPGAVRLRKVEDGQRRGELGQRQRRATLTVRTAYQRAQLRYDSVA